MRSGPASRYGGRLRASKSKRPLLIVRLGEQSAKGVVVLVLTALQAMPLYECALLL